MKVHNFLAVFLFSTLGKLTNFMERQLLFLLGRLNYVFLDIFKIFYYTYGLKYSVFFLMLTLYINQSVKPK